MTFMALTKKQEDELTIVKNEGVILSKADIDSINEIYKDKILVDKFKIKRYKVNQLVRAYLFYRSITEQNGKAEETEQSVTDHLERSIVEAYKDEKETPSYTRKAIFLAIGLWAFLSNNKKILDSFFPCSSPFTMDKKKIQSPNEVVSFSVTSGKKTNTFYYRQVSSLNPETREILETMKEKERKKVEGKLFYLIERGSMETEVGVYEIYTVIIENEITEVVKNFLQDLPTNTSDYLSDLKLRFPNAQFYPKKTICSDTENEEEKNILLAINSRSGKFFCTGSQDGKNVFVFILENTYVWTKKQKKQKPKDLNKVIESISLAFA